MKPMYQQYLNRLKEWTEDELDFISARIEFQDFLENGFSMEEAFAMVKDLRTEEWPQNQHSNPSQ